MSNPKTILVTGSQGQLGSELQLIGESSLHRFVLTDVPELDITDSEAVGERVALERPDVIVNCAAYTQVEQAEEEPDTADRINRIAVGNLARAARQADAVLIHISTDYVFDGSKNRPYTETDPVRPLGVYGRTKLAGEQAIAESGCRALIFRTAWLYSAFGHNFVKTMLRLTAERPELSVVFDQTGTPTWAADLARTLYTIVDRGLYTGNEGTYHYSNEGVCSWYDFAQEIARLSGHTACRISPCLSRQFPSRVERPAYSVLDKARFRETFGLEVPYWRDSLCQCLEILNLSE